VRNALIGAAILVAVVFVVSGFYFRAGVTLDYGAPTKPICGPLTDHFHSPDGNAGPCPTDPPLPSVLEWAPFWAH
jgi:hypothetical protein